MLFFELDIRLGLVLVVDDLELVQVEVHVLKFLRKLISAAQQLHNAGLIQLNQP